LSICIRQIVFYNVFFKCGQITLIVLKIINLNIVLLLLTDFTEVFNYFAAILVAQDH